MEREEEIIKEKIKVKRRRMEREEEIKKEKIKIKRRRMEREDEIKKEIYIYFEKKNNK